ncbi:MAG: BREX-6 system adenine-specific DNA-methyltransferase PglX, partial [Deltaproteobacteria bacterium]|nr:BREX-6 system adenine-specific DNA-methyltransferase PglX [Deltaproteobacteria bacterium]
MSTEAKAALGKTIRALRDELLVRLEEAMRKEYLLDLPHAKKPNLDAARRAKRLRFEALGVDRETLVKQAAYTLLNRLVVLKLMEGMGLRREKLVTGGTESRAYRDFRALSPAIVGLDDSEGYAHLLDLAYRELALDLPGLFGQSGAASALGLVPVPGFLLREVIKRLDDKALTACWQDDMTLGWVYQFWNDPEREALDAKLKDRKKLEPGEIASKTQMFTERYMVDWLLQNSLGPMWLAMCRKHGWTAEAERGGDNSVLSRLDARRAAWRGQRERGEVGPTELMPVHGEDEARWAYYVPQPIPAEAVEHAPESLDALKLIDPAVGSGHFLIVAFDLLMALHREEDRHRGRVRTDAAIAEHILEHNLHGVDLDPRAVQIAAAALWLKAKAVPGANPGSMNLVASQLRLGELGHDDAALVELRAAVFEETGVPAELTDTIVAALKGVDWLGSLLKVEDAVEKAIIAFEQQGLFAIGVSGIGRAAPGRQRSTWDLIEKFLATRTGGGDLGLRLHGEQLASGVRLVRMLREGQYDLVVGNPPYQGTAKMRETAYLTRHYPRGKADLYAMFLERGLQLVRPGGVSALLTMRGWMFIKQFAELRKWLVSEFDLRALGDLSSGAFEEISAAQVVVTVAMSIFARTKIETSSVALRLFDDRTLTSVGETSRKRAATLAQVGRHEFRASDLRVVPEWPLVYWWPPSRFIDYRESPQFQAVAPVRQGLITSD